MTTNTSSLLCEPESGCTLDDFADYVDGWPLCSTEVDAAFARLAGSDETGDPDLIEEIDVISWYNIVLEIGDREYIRVAARNYRYNLSGNIFSFACATAQQSYYNAAGVSPPSVLYNFFFRKP